MGEIQAEALVAQHAQEAELSTLLQGVIHETNPRAQRAKAMLQVRASGLCGGVVCGCVVGVWGGRGGAQTGHAHQECCVCAVLVVGGWWIDRSKGGSHCTHTHTHTHTHT